MGLCGSKSVKPLYSVDEKLEEAIASRAETLDLSKARAKSLPADIHKMDGLKELMANNNLLKTLPKGMWELVELTCLDLRNNQITVRT